MRGFPAQLPSLHFPAAVATLYLAAGLAPAGADTVFLKDGTQIPNCKVTAESTTHVSVSTPGGDMVVPRTEVYRILRTKTVHDTYKEQRAAIREGDAEGLYKLAQWCRNTNGLRKESDELLAEVIALKENHLGARKLLGHLKLGGEWVIPPPLILRLKASGPQAQDLRTALDLLLQSRRDIRLDPDTSTSPGGAASLDTCTLDASVIITRKAAGTFYGVSVGEPSYGATVRMQAKSPWIGTTVLKTAADGQVPASGGNSSLSVNNAFGTSGAFIHKFLDQLTEFRLRKIEEDFQKKKKEVKTAGAPARGAPARRA